MTAQPLLERETEDSPRIDRIKRTILPGAREDRLFFAQGREDPLLEIEALAPLEDAKVVVVGSGGCTALSLLASGAAHVTAVDLNSTQNHLIELKAAALRWLTMPETLSFFGVARGAPQRRARTYRWIRQLLQDLLALFWDHHEQLIVHGAL